MVLAKQHCQEHSAFSPFLSRQHLHLVKIDVASKVTVDLTQDFLGYQHDAAVEFVAAGGAAVDDPHPDFVDAVGSTVVVGSVNHL